MMSGQWDASWHAWSLVFYARHSGAPQTKLSFGVILSNTKSSTEAELVGASDYLPYPIWAKKFLAAQGYALRENIFYQDNQSTIRFEKNGRRSCGPNSRHIDIRYHYVRELVQSGEIVVVWVATSLMVADILTKSLDRYTIETLWKLAGCV